MPKKVQKLYCRLNKKPGRASYFVVKRTTGSDPLRPGDEVVITRRAGEEWRGTVFDLIAANDRLAVVQVFYSGVAAAEAGKADPIKPAGEEKVTVTIEGTPSDPLPAPEPEVADD